MCATEMQHLWMLDEFIAKVQFGCNLKWLHSSYATFDHNIMQELNDAVSQWNSEWNYGVLVANVSALHGSAKTLRN